MTSPFFYSKAAKVPWGLLHTLRPSERSGVLSPIPY